MKNTFLSIGLLAILFSCSEGKQESSQNEIQEVKKESVAKECFYDIDAEGSTLYWTAFKHTAKVGVKGNISDINIKYTSKTDLASSINDATFSINTSSSDSKDAARDKKIGESFFGNLIDGATFTGKMMGFSGNENEGTGSILLSMNAIEKDVKATYSVEDGILKVRTSVNLNDWNAQEALAALNAVCAEKHTGKDGENVLWPDVDILVQTAISTRCN